MIQSKRRAAHTRARLYARFSPRPDADECDSIERQFEEMRQECARLNIEVAGEYQDAALSGADEQRRYSPAKIKSVSYEQAFNLPKRERICTSHVERSNLNLRTFIRRMTRLSNGFSKKWANHEAALALYICHYNYVRVHGTLKTTPAVASGIEAHKWTMRDLIERTATH